MSVSSQLDKILVVDDDVLIRDMMVDILEGYTVHTAFLYQLHFRLIKIFPLLNLKPVLPQPCTHQLSTVATGPRTAHGRESQA